MFDIILDCLVQKNFRYTTSKMRFVIVLLWALF